MLWASITLPRLALDWVLRHHARPEAPLVLLGGTPQQRVLTAVNPAAARLGLHAGQRLTEAQAMASGFSAVVGKPSDVAQARQLLAQWAYRYTDQVCLGWPDALLLEVGASLRLMGGWAALSARLGRELAEWQFEHRIGVAPTAHAAHVLAGWEDGTFVDTLPEMRRLLSRGPVARADLPDGAGSALQRLGIRRLGQLMQMPRDGLQRRFGQALCRHLDWLQGEVPAVLDCYRPPAHFRMRLELACRVEHHLPLLFPLRRMLSDLVGFLDSRGCGTTHLSLWLDHDEDDAPPTRLDIRLMRPERDLSLFIELLKTRLEHQQLPAPVTALRLSVTDLPAFVPAVPDLFDQTGPERQPWPAWQARLRARLGDEALHQLEARDEHRPEHAWQRRAVASSEGRSGSGASGMSPAADAGGAPGGKAAPMGRLPARPASAAFARPAWLLPEPVPLREGIQHVLAGPERIESGWWDGHEVRRDYYEVETVRGQRAWVYTAVGGHGPWMLHGWFA